MHGVQAIEQALEGASVGHKELKCHGDYPWRRIIGEDNRQWERSY